MTIEEIKAIIAQKIAGQGNQVDIGNGLPEILNSIVELIEAIPAPSIDYLEMTLPDGFNFSNKSKSEAAELLGITSNDIDSLQSGKIVNVTFSNDTHPNNNYIIGCLGTMIAFCRYMESTETFRANYVLSEGDGIYGFYEV